MANVCGPSHLPPPAVILLFFLYKKIKGRYSSRSEDPEEKNHDVSVFPLASPGFLANTYNQVPPPQYVEKVAELEPTELVPPIQDHPDESISMPVPEPAPPNYTPEPCVTTNTINEPLPMPVVMPSRKDTLADKFKNVLQKAKRTATM